jgi:hypothetical protein
MLAAVVAVFFIGCDARSPDAIGSTVKKGLQQQLDTNPAFKDDFLVVREVSVVHEQANRYKGLASVVFEGETHQIPVNITADGENILYEIEPGAFLFIAEKRLRGL